MSPCLSCHSCRGDLTPTPYTHLYHGSSGPALNLTLEGQLLNQWSSGSPHYDALFLQDIPPVDQLLTSVSGQGPSLTLLVNQSAVSGLPAALNQATSALLRLIVAAGGAKGSPMHTATAGAVHSLGTDQLQAADGFADGAAGVSVAGADHSSSSSRGGSRLGSIPRRFAAAAKPGAAGCGSPRTSGSYGACGHANSSVVGGPEGSISSSSRRGPPGGGHLPSCTPVITAVSSPLPLMLGEKAQRVRQDAGALMLVLCMTLAASVLSASFVVFPVRWVSKP
jgi:hypothetical protein